MAADQPPTKITADNLDAVMEFDHVIQVHPDGTVTDAPRHITEPVLRDDKLLQSDGTQWTLMTGYTGQHGYNGPIMHPSERIGGGMAKGILATPGYYVALVATYSGEEGDEGTGWVVARMDAPNSQ